MLLVMSKKEHWENVFSTKTEKEVSWYQDYPSTSMEVIESLNLPKNAAIIDIGGGDSYLIDALLEKGYTNLYLLDISAKAIERIQARLAERAKNVKFIVSDVLDFQTDITFDLWHDRASFHFLTEEKEIKNYSENVAKYISTEGNMIIGTFSENGPKKCSGLDITQYSEEKMKAVFGSIFDLQTCFTHDHTTPFETIQNFIFCTFKKKTI
jgi:cyclopropane fatty-acyl-phospholipid synthase-like methyltransferase